MQRARAAGIGQVVAAALIVSGCSSEPAVTTNPPAAVPPVSAAAGENGLIRVAGRAPVAGGFPAIVLLEPQQGSVVPPQVVVPYMDQVQQTFTPPILLARTGQPTEFRNNDEVLHNVRVYEDTTREPAFNVAIPNGEKFQFAFARDGFYDVGCDIHPAMSATVVASSTPYMTIAAADGSFVIDNVPPGSYRAVVFAGPAKTETAVEIAAGKSELDLARN